MTANVQSGLSELQQCFEIRYEFATIDPNTVAPTVAHLTEFPTVDTAHPFRDVAALENRLAIPYHCLAECAVLADQLRHWVSK